MIEVVSVATSTARTRLIAAREMRSYAFAAARRAIREARVLFVAVKTSTPISRWRPYARAMDYLVDVARARLEARIWLMEIREAREELTPTDSSEDVMAPLRRVSGAS